MTAQEEKPPIRKSVILGRVDGPILEALDEIARRKRRSRSFMVAEAVEEYVSRERQDS